MQKIIPSSAMACNAGYTLVMSEPPKSLFVIAPAGKYLVVCMLLGITLCFVLLVMTRCSGTGIHVHRQRVRKTGINVLQWCMWAWHGLKHSRCHITLTGLLLPSTSIVLFGHQGPPFLLISHDSTAQGRLTFFLSPPIPKFSPTKTPLA